MVTALLPFPISYCMIDRLIQIDNNPFWDCMTRGGINFIYTHLCGSIAYGVILSITHEVEMLCGSIAHEVILSNSYKVEMLYIYIYIHIEVLPMKLY